MPLQNRVDPFGEIHAVPARGMFTGNRGSIHDADTRTLLKRRWTTKAWIICDCGYKGRKRAVFGRNTRSGRPGWTNLFFLDDVTALAAGHRPCFECRREKAKEYADCFARAFDVSTPKVAEIDTRLHAERRASGGKAVPLARQAIPTLPDGAMFTLDGRPYAIRHGEALAWNFGGYTDRRALVDLPEGRFTTVTPQTSIAVLGAGFKSVWAA